MKTKAYCANVAKAEDPTFIIKRTVLVGEDRKADAEIKLELDKKYYTNKYPGRYQFFISEIEVETSEKKKK